MTAMSPTAPGPAFEELLHWIEDAFADPGVLTRLEHELRTVPGLLTEAHDDDQALAPRSVAELKTGLLPGGGDTVTNEAAIERGAYQPRSA